MNATEGRTFNDTQRIAQATHDGSTTIGPLEAARCVHGHLYAFRYQWPRGSGGPNDGELHVLENKCLDCALQGWLRPGTTRKV